MRKSKKRGQAMVEYMIVVTLMGLFAFRVAGDLGRGLAGALDACSDQITRQITDVLTGRRRVP